MTFSSMRFIAACAALVSAFGCAELTTQSSTQSSTKASTKPANATPALSSQAANSAPAAYWEGVPFSHEEAKAVLAYANIASEQALDEDCGLDSRAVRSILEARPISSMAELTSLYFVGAVALRRLKQAVAPTPSATFGSVAAAAPQTSSSSS